MRKGDAPDDEIDRYARTHYAQARVPDFPELLVKIVESRTGKGFDLRMWREYERARAFVRFAGVAHTAPLPPPPPDIVEEVEGDPLADLFDVAHDLGD